MKWFETYGSNTLAGSGNQYVFFPEDDEVHTGRIYYKVFAGGTYRYSLLFTNMVDSTYSDGSVSHCNLICDEWELVSASVGVCEECSMENAGEVKNSKALTFGGCGGKKVMPGEFFTTDPVEVTAAKDEYLCVEISYRGKMIPYHEESIIPAFELQDGKWVPGKHMPFPGMIGCDRKVKAKIGFMGDSITQGIGTTANAYVHWNAVTAENIGDSYSYWNLGLGFGRAQDAASNSAWLFKAKQLDAVVLCYGTNDVGQGRDLEQIKKDLYTIVTKLKEAGVKVLLQNLPPFDWKGQLLEKWNLVNAYVEKELKPLADSYFDTVPVLIEGEPEGGVPKYTGHPNDEGCKAWAEELTPVMKAFVEKL